MNPEETKNPEIADMQVESDLPPQKDCSTWGKLKDYRSQLGKYSKEVFLHSIACNCFFRDAGHVFLWPTLEEMKIQCAALAPDARRLNRVKRLMGTMRRIKDGTWRPPKKRKRKRKGAKV